MTVSEQEQEHEHFIEAIYQTSDNPITVLYGCADCGLQFEEEVIEE